MGLGVCAMWVRLAEATERAACRTSSGGVAGGLALAALKRERESGLAPRSERKRARPLPLFLTCWFLILFDATVKMTNGPTGHLKLKCVINFAFKLCIQFQLELD